MSEIKNVRTCAICKYGYRNQCQNTLCVDCTMNYYRDTTADPYCKCCLIKDGDECPYFEEE